MHSYYYKVPGTKCVKAELHVHLEGSIDPETLLAIDPSLSREEIAAHYTCRSFEQFIQGYIWVNRKIEKPEHYALATRHLLDRLGGPGGTYPAIMLPGGMILWEGGEILGG